MWHIESQFLGAQSWAMLYPLTVLSDGCLLIAITLASTLGGRPLLWGLSFGVAHFFYSAVGVVLTEELSHRSEIFGDLLVLAGSIVLLKHFFHHHNHHVPGGDCGCHNHADQATPVTIILTAAGLSLHALASGAVVNQIMEPAGVLPKLALVFSTALLIGCAVFLSVLFSDRDRNILTKTLDRIPGVTAGILVFTTLYCSLHIASHYLTKATESSLLIGSVVLSCGVCMIIQIRAAIGRMPSSTTPSAPVKIAAKRG